MSKMATAIRLRNLPEFFIARFPFFNAISLLLLLAERAQNERFVIFHGFTKMRLRLYLESNNLTCRRL